MYDTDGYYTRPASRFSGTSSRNWLIVAGALAAVVALLFFVVAAWSAPSNENDPLAAPVETTPATDDTTAASPTPSNDTADGAGAVATGGDADQGGNDAPEQEPAEEPAGEPEEPAEQPVAPLSIEVSVDTITPNGQCFASGTIAVSGGTYPMTVHYQWRRLTFGGGLDGEPVSAVANHTFTEAGEIHPQTSDLPEDGTNVYLLVTGPKQKGSGLTEYDGCTTQPVIIFPGN